MKLDLENLEIENGLEVFAVECLSGGGVRVGNARWNALSTRTTWKDEGHLLIVETHASEDRNNSSFNNAAYQAMRKFAWQKIKTQLEAERVDVMAIPDDQQERFGGFLKQHGSKKMAHQGTLGGHISLCCPSTKPDFVEVPEFLSCQTQFLSCSLSTALDQCLHP